MLKVLIKIPKPHGTSWNGGGKIAGPRGLESLL